MPIDRCICTRCTFEELLAIARKRGLDLRQLAAATGCTQQCGLCRPYVRRALASGQTTFHEILTELP